MLSQKHMYKRVCLFLRENELFSFNLRLISVVLLEEILANFNRVIKPLKLYILMGSHVMFQYMYTLCNI
jgi:hypothetical protein